MATSRWRAGLPTLQALCLHPSWRPPRDLPPPLARPSPLAAPTPSRGTGSLGRLVPMKAAHLLDPRRVHGLHGLVELQEGPAHWKRGGAVYRGVDTGVWRTARETGWPRAMPELQGSSAGARVTEPLGKGGDPPNTHMDSFLWPETRTPGVWIPRGPRVQRPRAPAVSGHSPPPASKLGVPCRMTKCRKSGAVFIFTVPDRSPLRNCTYLQSGGGSGSAVPSRRCPCAGRFPGSGRGPSPHHSERSGPRHPRVTLGATARARHPSRIPECPTLQAAPPLSPSPEPHGARPRGCHGPPTGEEMLRPHLPPHMKTLDGLPAANGQRAHGQADMVLTRWRSLWGVQ